MIREPAFAKVNLFLEVAGRLPNGYHHLQSLMVFADVGEWVSIAPAQAASFEISGPQSADLDPRSQDNLALKAVYAFQQAHLPSAAYAVHLHKTMPVSSGIGGGSADAAAVLRALNTLHAHPLKQAALLDIAASLGADVPACLISKPVTLNGTGRELRPAEIVGCRHAILVNPRQSVSTPAVFDALSAPAIRSVPPLAQTSWTLGCLRQRRNDLRAPAGALCPDIDRVLSFLSQLPDVLIAQMSGSGATCFALFEHANTVTASLKVLRTQRPSWWSVQAEFGD